MISSKTCISCHKTKKVSNYYIHRDNKPGYGLNNQCKECSKKQCTDLENLKIYCDLNSRRFSQDLYEVAVASVNKKYENDVDFNSLSEEDRKSFLFKKIVNIYFSRQGQTQYYSYLNTDQSPVLIETVEDDNSKIDSEDLTKDGKQRKIYSEVWRGSYTKSQIDWLDAYYEDTILDYKILTRNHRDYCRKIVKASLAQDEASNDMLNDIPGAEKRFDKATATFDKLSQSAKLSESKRSANEVSGLSSVSEIVAQLEQTGFLQKKMTFDKDDIDVIGEDFRWTITSVGGEL